LIEGASSGIGLGHDFLRHIERTRLLLHVIDVTASDPLADYHIIQQELTVYDRGLPQRPQIIALNKIDAVESEILTAVSKELASLTDAPIFQISAATRTGLDNLLQEVWSMLDNVSHL
jgi:GTP-binding protein